jgi:hypothetical protein
VAAAALALQRLFTWQSQREEFAPAK